MLIAQSQRIASDEQINVGDVLSLEVQWFNALDFNP